jgi:predicted ABC-type transport system involved in lysophospholipase L1 biosynthesis ATPase subunit
MLEIHGLSKSFGGPNGRTVLRDVSLTLVPGEYVAIVGESGVGKSTLLNLIAGLDVPDAGELKLEGKDLAQLDEQARTLVRRSRMGFVFQAFHLLPHLDLSRNVGLPLALNGVAGAEAAGRVRELLQAVGLADRAKACHASCPAANCNESRWRVRWRIGRHSCSRTSRQAISTRTTRRASSKCCERRSSATMLRASS